MTSRLGDEKWLCRLTSALGEPNTQEGDHTRGNRRDPRLPSLPYATDVRASAEMNIADAKADQF